MGSYTVFSQDEADTNTAEQKTEVVEEAVVKEAAPVVPKPEKQSFHQVIKQKFIEGGPSFMGVVLLCLILGLALAIERIIYLNMATSDSTKLLNVGKYADVKVNTVAVPLGSVLHVVWLCL